jgi:hypothetical protein
MHKTSLKNPRVIRFKVDRVLLDGADGEAAVKRLMRDYGWAAARMHRHWLLWHEQAGTPEKIHRGEKTGPAFPASLKAELYRVGTRAAPHINPTSIQWLNQWLMRTVNEQTSAKHNRKKWCAIVHGDEDASAFDRLPLRVYDTFARIELADDGRHWLSAKLVKNGEGRYRSLRLRLVKPHAGDGTGATDFRAKREFLRAIERGENKMPCSQIVLVKGQLYFALTIDRPVEAVQIDPQKTLFLRPSRHAAWRARYNGQSVLIGADRLMDLGRARQKHKASRRRRSRWRDYCTTLNHQLSCEIAKSAAGHGVGRVVVYDGTNRSAVVRCGSDGERARTVFPLQQFRVFLRQKLTPLGVEVIERSSLRSIKRRIERGKRRLRAVPPSKASKGCSAAGCSQMAPATIAPQGVAMTGVRETVD